MRQFPFCGGCGCVRSVCICESRGETVSNEDRPAEIVQTDGGWRLTLIRTFETIAQAAAVIEAAESAGWGDDVRVELATPPKPTESQWRVGGKYRSRNGHLLVTIIDTNGHAKHFAKPQPIVGRDQVGQVRSWSENGRYFGTDCESVNDLMPGEITEAGDVTPPTVRGPAE